MALGKIFYDKSRATDVAAAKRNAEFSVANLGEFGDAVANFRDGCMTKTKAHFVATGLRGDSPIGTGVYRNALGAGDF